VGKTSKPLVIVVSKHIAHWPIWEEKRLQGHTIVELEEADLFIGPECWYMDNQHEKYAQLAMDSARARAYPPPPKKEKK